MSLETQLIRVELADVVGKLDEATRQEVQSEYKMLEARQKKEEATRLEVQSEYKMLEARLKKEEATRLEVQSEYKMLEARLKKEEATRLEVQSEDKMLDARLKKEEATRLEAQLELKLREARQKKEDLKKEKVRMEERLEQVNKQEEQKRCLEEKEREKRRISLEDSSNKRREQNDVVNSSQPSTSTAGPSCIETFNNLRPQWKRASDLMVGRRYGVQSLVRVVARYGPTLLATLQQDNFTFNLYLPQAYASTISEAFLSDINSVACTYTLTYSGLDVQKRQVFQIQRTDNNRF